MAPKLRRKRTLYPVPTLQERKFYTDVFASEQYGRAKADLFSFCAGQDWSNLKGTPGLLEAVHQAIRTHTSATLTTAWSLLGPLVEDSGLRTGKLEATQARLIECQRAYLQEVTQLKDQGRAKKGRTDLDNYVPDFNEDLEFYDAVQFYPDEEKELIKLIVADKVKTAVSRALNGSLDLSSLSGGGASKEELANLNAEIEKLKEKLEETQQEVRAQREKNADLELEMSQLQQEMKDRCAEYELQISSLTEEKEALEAERADLMARLDVETEKNAVLTEQNETLQTEVNILQDDLRVAEEAALALKVELSECKGQLEEATASAAKFEEEKRQVEAAAAAAAAASAAMEKKLNDRIEELEGLLADMRALIASLKQQVAEEIGKRKEAEALLKSSREALKVAQKQIEDLEKENAKLLKKVTEMEIRFADMQEAIQKMRSDGAAAGVGAQLDELLDKNGLNSKKEGPRSVFNRLYKDAVERMERLEAHRQEILRVQRETLLRVLAAKQNVISDIIPDMVAPISSMAPMASNAISSNAMSPISPISPLERRGFPSLDRMNLGAKSMPSVDAMQFEHGKTPMFPSVESFPLMDRAHKLEPIDRKVQDLKRQMGGNLN